MVFAILAETTEPIFSFLMLRLVSSVMARVYPLPDFLAAGFLAAFLAAVLWTGDALVLACALVLGLASFLAAFLASCLAAFLAFFFTGAFAAALALCTVLAFWEGASTAALCGSSICSSRSRST